MSLKNIYIIFKTIVISLLIFTIGEAKTYHVTILTKDGKEIKGELIQLAPEGVRIDPEGPVSFSLYKAERLVSVYITELDQTFNYPLAEQDIPKDLLSTKKLPRKYGEGFPRFLGAFSYGAVTAGDDGYYEGFGSGSTFHLNLRYLFADDDPHSSRFFIGFSYYRSSPKADSYRGFIGYDEYGYPVYATIEFKLNINHYALEFGGTSRSFGKDSYLYWIFGAAILDNNISIPLDSGNNDSPELSYDDSVLGIRFGGGLVIGIASRLGILLSLEADFVYSGSYTDEYGQQRPTATGWLPNATAGLVYGFK